eukprot:s549_g15.t1
MLWSFGPSALPKVAGAVTEVQELTKCPVRRYDVFTACVSAVKKTRPDLVPTIFLMDSYASNDPSIFSHHPCIHPPAAIRVFRSSRMAREAGSSGGRPCSGPAGPLLVIQAGMVCLDLSWRNAGSQLARYLTNNLQEELVEMVLSKRKEDEPCGYLDVNVSKSDLRAEGMSLLLNFLCRLHKVNPPICVQNFRCYSNSGLGDPGIRLLSRLIASQPYPLRELHLSTTGISEVAVAILVLSVGSSERYPFQTKEGTWTGCWMRVDNNEILAPITLVTALKSLKTKGVEMVARQSRTWMRYTSPSWATSAEVTPAALLYLINEQKGEAIGSIGSSQAAFQESASAMRRAQQAVTAAQRLLEVEGAGDDPEDPKSSLPSPERRVAVARWSHREVDPKSRDSDIHVRQCGTSMADANSRYPMAVGHISHPRHSGDPKYDIQDIVTPAAAGTTLRLLSWLLADSPLGPLIRRVLLSQETNGSALLQDLALQASHECGNFAMWHPMQRLSSEERKQQEEAAKVAGPEEFLQKGFGSGATTPYVTVEDFAKAYREKRTTPSQTMEKLLQFRPFVKLLEEDVRRQAQESDRRFRSGEARSIFEGVPVAVKDMFRIRGYPMLEGSLWPEGSDRNSPAEKDGRGAPEGSSLGS